MKIRSYIVLSRSQWHNSSLYAPKVKLCVVKYLFTLYSLLSARVMSDQ